MLTDLLNYLLDTTDRKMEIQSSYYNGRSGIRANSIFSITARKGMGIWRDSSLFIYITKEWRKRIFFY